VGPAVIVALDTVLALTVLALTVVALTVVALTVVALTVVAFFRQQRLAGALLVPYVGWAQYATSLNARVAVLN
jgi:tryptophan-rich sensory protein